MLRSSRLLLALAALFFGIFFANVTTGAMGGTVFLGDIAEMLTLFIASLFFVGAVLCREALAKAQDTDSQTQS